MRSIFVCLIVSLVVASAFPTRHIPISRSFYVSGSGEVQQEEAGPDLSESSQFSAEPSFSLSSMKPPAKLRLPQVHQDLPKVVELEQDHLAESVPDQLLAAQNLQTETLAPIQGKMLGIVALPAEHERKQLQGEAVTETLKTITRAPQYRQQIIEQNVIQPVLKMQPFLRQRFIEEDVMTPHIRTQQVIQPVITQPLLRRHIRQQPIVQQQLREQEVVQRRFIEQPQLFQRLTLQPSVAPQQIQKINEGSLPLQTVQNQKVASYLQNSENRNMVGSSNEAQESSDSGEGSQSE